MEGVVEYAGRLRAIVIELHEEALVNPLEADDERGIPFSDDALQQPQRRILRLPCAVGQRAVFPLHHQPPTPASFAVRIWYSR